MGEEDDIESMFENYTQKDSLFDQKDALTTSWTPGEILHRDDQINELASILAPSLKGNDPSNVFVYGSVGTGKTLVTKHVIDKLESAANKQDAKLQILYVNCKMQKVADTEYRLMARLANELGVDVPETGLSTEQVYSRFFNALKNQTGVVIIALDEIDALVKKAGDDFLYNLTRANDDIENAKVSVLGVSNDLNFTDYMDSRVKSSLSQEEIIFPPYNALELNQILQQRAESGFNDSALGDGVISKCSALAAQEHGDARRALKLLRVAGELSERRGNQKIQKAHVDKAQDEIEKDRILETIREQPKQSRLVLYVILELLEDEDDEKVATGDVYSRYEELCDQTGANTLTQRRVSDLISELDMLGIINGSIVSKGNEGRTREITVDISDQIKTQIRNMVEKKFYLSAS